MKTPFPYPLIQTLSKNKQLTLLALPIWASIPQGVVREINRHPSVVIYGVCSDYWKLGMHAPSYRWRCHKCDRVSEPGHSMCAHCGFPAVASGVQIARARGEPSPTREGYRSLEKPLWLVILLPWEWF